VHVVPRIGQWQAWELTQMRSENSLHFMLEKLCKISINARYLGQRQRNKNSEKSHIISELEKAPFAIRFDFQMFLYMKNTVLLQI